MHVHTYLYYIVIHVHNYMYAQNPYICTCMCTHMSCMHVSISYNSRNSGYTERHSLTVKKATNSEFFSAGDHF